MDALPTELVVPIAGYLAATLESTRPDLRSLRATCYFMRLVCRNRAVGQRIALERAAKEMWRKNHDRDGVMALQAHLTKISNPEACFTTGPENAFSTDASMPWPCIVELARAAERGHNVAAYVAVILLYRANNGAEDVEAARRYM